MSRAAAWPGRYFRSFAPFLEVLAEKAIPREESQRFRREGNFILRVLLNLATASRLHIFELEHELQSFERALAYCDLPRDARLEFAQLTQLCRDKALSNDEINHRLDLLRELRVLPE